MDKNVQQKLVELSRVLSMLAARYTAAAQYSGYSYRGQDVVLLTGSQIMELTDILDQTSQVMTALAFEQPIPN